MMTQPWFLEAMARDRIEAARREAEIARLLQQAHAEPASEPIPEPAPWREAFPGVEFRPLVGGPQMVMAQMRFRRGATVELHRHSSAQSGYVMEGKLRITLPDQQLTIAAGQCYLLPPNVPHQVRALERSFVLDVFAPGEVPAAGAADEVLAAVTAGRTAGPVSQEAQPARAGQRRSRTTAGARRASRRAGLGVRRAQGDAA